jgi:hypothetical protein
MQSRQRAQTLFFLSTVAFILGFALTAAAVEQPRNDTGTQNEESFLMKQALRPYLDLAYNPNKLAGKIAAAMPAQLAASVERKRRILVLTYKTRSQLHLRGAAALLLLLREAEKKYGAFELTEVYTSESIDAKMLSRFDAVVLNNISIAASTKPTDLIGYDSAVGVRTAEEDALYNKLLPEYVKNGGGLFADHGSALLYVEHPEAEYNNMLGGFSSWSPLLGTKAHPTIGVHPIATGNWNFCSAFPIKLPEPENPLAAAFRGVESVKLTVDRGMCWGRSTRWPVTFTAPPELADELYVISPESNKDHASRPIVMVDKDKVPKTSFPGANDFSYALIWIRSYGKGRVYYSQLGHYEDVFTIPCVARLMLNGLQYVTGDLKVPPMKAEPIQGQTR